MDKMMGISRETLLVGFTDEKVAITEDVRCKPERSFLAVYGLGQSFESHKVSVR